MMFPPIQFLKYLKRTICILIAISHVPVLVGQSYWFGAKGGGSLAYQSWGDGSFGGSINRNPLLALHGDVFVESYDELNKGSLYASAGYHTRGSSILFQSINNPFTTFQGFKFHNAVLELGAKKPFTVGKEYNIHAFVGVRGEYTFATNLSDYAGFSSLFYPVDEFVRKINYGISFGGGFTHSLSDLVELIGEISLMPDLSFQYEQPPIPFVVDPFTGQLVNLGLRQVRNLTIEFKVGMRFLRKVEYID